MRSMVEGQIFQSLENYPSIALRAVPRPSKGRGGTGWRSRFYSAGVRTS